MKILIAEDDPIARTLLVNALTAWGHEVATADNGLDAWVALQLDPPDVAFVDWMMPGLEGPELCRRFRAENPDGDVYLILLTSRDSRADVLTGLAAGANDYMVKPVDQPELKARLEVARATVELRRTTAARVRELETALAQVRRLRGTLPICSYCKKIRDGKNYWEQFEAYITHHSDACFSHGVCPDCVRDVVEPQLRAFGVPPARSRPVCCGAGQG